MLPESSSRPLPAKMAKSRNLAHASLETVVAYHFCLALPAAFMQPGVQLSAETYLQRLLEVEEVLPLRVAERRVVDVSPKVDLRRAAHGLPVRSVLPR